MEKRDYYDVLGLKKDANEAEIKSSFRKMAKQYHPDINKESDAEDKFKEVQEAYSVLSDETKKRQYDQYGHSAPGGFNSQGFNSQGFDFSGFDFSDIINDAFGGSFNFGGFGGRSSSNRARKGQDKLHKMKLTFMEAVLGTKKDLEMELYETCEKCSGKGGHNETTCSHCKGLGTVDEEQRTLFGNFLSKKTCPICSGKGVTYKEKCSQCNGAGKVKQRKTISITVPPGVDNDNQLRLSGKGETGINGGPNGDLYIEFIVMEHDIFIREEKDIYVHLPITITEAILGCKKEVPTLDSTVLLNIPAGSKTNDKHKLKQKGVVDVHGKKKGDLYVVINIVIPTKLTKEQKKMVEELAKTDLTNEPQIKKFNTFLKDYK